MTGRSVRMSLQDSFTLSDNPNRQTAKSGGEEMTSETFIKAVWFKPQLIFIRGNKVFACHLSAKSRVPEINKSKQTLNAFLTIVTLPAAFKCEKGW